MAKENSNSEKQQETGREEKLFQLSEYRRKIIDKQILELGNQDAEIKRLKEEIRQHRKEYSDLEARFETHIGEQTEQLHHENQMLKRQVQAQKKNIEALSNP